MKSFDIFTVIGQDVCSVLVLPILFFAFWQLTLAAAVGESEAKAGRWETCFHLLAVMEGDRGTMFRHGFWVVVMFLKFSPVFFGVFCFFCQKDIRFDEIFILRILIFDGFFCHHPGLDLVCYNSVLLHLDASKWSTSS